MSIVYYATSKNDSTKITEIEKEVNVIEPKRSTFLADYFIKDNVDICIEEYDLKFETNNNDNSFSFVNALSKYHFAFDLNAMNSDFVKGSKNVNPNFDGINIILTDSKNTNKQVLLTIMKATETKNGVSSPILESKNSAVYINNKFASNISGSFYGTTSNLISISYNYKNKSFIDINNNNVIGSVSNYLDGAPFDGFESDTIFVSFEFINVIGKSQIIMTNLAGQPLGIGHTDDMIAPTVILNSEIPTKLQVNYKENVKLPGAKAFDVLSPNPSLTLLITDPNKKVLYNGDASDGYSFIPNIYGKYVIKYTAIDSSENNFDVFYTLNVVDEEKPEIELYSDIPSIVKVGKKVLLPSYSVKDNVSTNLYKTVVLFTPDGTMRDLTDAKNFAVDYSGLYKLVYYTRDDMGNTCMKIFVISAVN